VKIVKYLFIKKKIFEEIAKVPPILKNEEAGTEYQILKKMKCNILFGAMFPQFFIQNSI